MKTDRDSSTETAVHSTEGSAQDIGLPEEEQIHFQAKLLDAVGQAVIATDTQGNVIYWNRAAENLYGWSQQEAMGRSIVEITPSEELMEHAYQIMSELMAGRSWSGEFTVRRKDGTSFPAMVTDTPVLDEEGNVVAIIGVSTDITEFKETEQLRRSEERFRSLVQNATDIISLVDANGTIRYVSPAVERVTGYKPEEQVGTNAFEAIHPDDRQTALEIYGEILNKPGIHPPLEFRVPHKDGTWCYFEHTINNLLDDPAVGAIVVNSHDMTERRWAEEALRESEEKFRLLAENAQDLIVRYRLKPTRAFEYVSPSSITITGYTPEEYYADPELGFKIAHPDDKHLLDEALHHPEAPSTIRWVRKDGRVIWTEQRNKPIYDEAGELVAIEGIARDVTPRKENEEALRSSEEFFRALYENAQHPIFLLDSDLNFVDVNPYACEFYGYGLEEFRRMKVSDIALPEEHDDQLRSLERVRKRGRVFIHERRHRKKNGEIITVTADAGKVTRSGQELYVSKITDITERKRAEEQLEHQAFHDLLTELPNRYLLLDRLGQALKRTKRTKGRKVAMLFMDLDNFKAINDSLGHEVGDRLLMAVSERLKESIRPEDTLARFGGDEFAILLEQVESSDDAIRVAERITGEFRGPFVVDSRELFVRLSIGVAIGESRTKSAEDLIRDADTAMYRAKESATGYMVFDPQMYLHAIERLELENDLRRAIEGEEEFALHYQPIVDLRSGEVSRVEALLRWNHSERGLLNPSDFLAVVEESGLIVPMGERVLDVACRQAKEWQDEYPGIAPLVMSVNLSARQLRRPDLADTLGETLQRTGFEAQCLSLDITETVYIKVLEGNTQALDDLKKLGVKISIDDFGVGYSSLSYLKRLPADVLKIDKSFVKGLGEDVEDTAIVGMIIELAHTLGMEVIAEGVESSEQAALLEELGCDMAQGFYIASPLPAEEASEFLAERRVP